MVESFENNDQLPELVQIQLSDKNQTKWREIFNDILEATGDESKAYQTASDKTNFQPRGEM